MTTPQDPAGRDATRPAGYAQAGVVTRLFDPPTTLVSSGVAALAIGLATLLFARRLHRLV